MGRRSRRADGADDAWVSPSIDFTSTDKITIVCSVRNTITSGAGIISEFGFGTGSSAGAFYLAGGTDGPTGYTSLARGTAPQDASQRVGYSIAAPNTSVIVVTHDISGDLSTMEVNGVAAPPATGDKGSGNFGNFPLFFFARTGNTIFFRDGLYRYAIFGRLLTAGEKRVAKAWAAKPAGVVLP